MCLEQQYRKVKKEVLYDFNFAHLEDNLKEFCLENIHLGHTYNKVGLLVKPYYCNKDAFIMFKRPILCNYDDVIIELEIYKLSNEFPNPTLYIHNGIKCIKCKSITKY